MNLRTGLVRILSAGALMLGFPSLAAAKASPPEPIKAGFDADGKVMVSDKALLRRLGVSTDKGGLIDLRLPKGVAMSGPELNLVCGAGTTEK